MLRNIESDDLYKFRSNQSFNILDIIPRQLNPRKSNTIKTYPVKKYFSRFIDWMVLEESN